MQTGATDWFIFVFVAFSLRADNGELDENSTVLNKGYRPDWDSKQKRVTAAAGSFSNAARQWIAGFNPPFEPPIGVWVLWENCARSAV